MHLSLFTYGDKNLFFLQMNFILLLTFLIKVKARASPDKNAMEFHELQFPRSIENKQTNAYACIGYNKNIF